MLVIDDIIKCVIDNIRTFLITGSILALLSIILTITIICLICWYVKHYRYHYTLILDDPSVIPLFNKHVTHLQVVKATILKGYSMPCSNSFSHWFIKAVLENGPSVSLSSSGINNIHIRLFSEDIKNEKKAFKLPLEPVIAPSVTTLYDVAYHMFKAINNTIYGYNLYNCQDLVYNTMRYFTKTKMQKPFKNKELLHAVCTELI